MTAFGLMMAHETWIRSVNSRAIRGLLILFMKTDEAEAAETKPREISVGNILRWNDDVHYLFPHMRLVGLFITCVGSLTVIISHSKRLRQASDELLFRYVT